jgi:hypothetical protein
MDGVQCSASKPGIRRGRERMGAFESGEKLDEQRVGGTFNGAATSLGRQVRQVGWFYSGVLSCPVQVKPGRSTRAKALRCQTGQTN